MPYDRSGERAYKSDEDDLAYHLSRINSRMRTLGLMSLGFTLLNFAVLSIGVPYIMFVGSRYSYILLMVTSLSTITAFFAMVSLALLDRRKREGEAVFQELSEQLEAEAGRDLDNRKISSRMRVTIREFGQSAELPLISGRSGSTIYAVVNIVITIVTVALVVFLSANLPNYS